MTGKSNTVSVYLRALEPGDVDLLYKWENNRGIWTVSNTITPFSKYILTRYIENSHLDIYQTRQLRLMIDISDNDKHTVTIGAVDLFDFEPYHLRAGVGILIGNEGYKGKGYASYALEELIHYAFDTLQLHQLFANILVENKTSLKLFQNHGFKKAGIKKHWIKTPYEYKDEYLLQLINPGDLT